MTGNDLAAHAFRLNTLVPANPHGDGKYFLEPLIELPRPASLKAAKQVRLGFRYRAIPSSDPDDDNNWGHHQDMLGLEYRDIPTENVLYDVTPGEGERVIFDTAGYNERVRACTRVDAAEEDDAEKEVWILMADRRGILPFQELWECRKVKLVMVGLNDNIFAGNVNGDDDDGADVQSVSTAGGESQGPTSTSPEKDDEASSNKESAVSRSGSVYNTPILSRQRGHSRDFPDVSEFRLDEVASNSQASSSHKSAGKATFRLQDDKKKDKEEERKDNDEERKNDGDDN